MAVCFSREINCISFFFLRNHFHEFFIFDISGEPRLVFPNATAGGHPRVGQFASPFHPNVASTPAGNNEIQFYEKYTNHLHENLLRVNYSKKGLG